MAANVEKSSPLIRSVDEVDFKQTPVSVKRSKKEDGKNVLNEINDEFVDEFIGVIHDVYHKKMTAIDKKAVLLISLSSSWEFVT